VLQVTQSGDFEQPPEEVFDFIVDNRNERDWHPLLKSVEATPDTPAVGVGTVFDAEYKRLGTTRAEIVEYDRPRHARFDVVTNIADMDMSFDFAPREGGGTRLTLTAGVEPKGVLKLAGPFAKRMFDKELSKRPQQFREALAARGLM
jgi:carbon monoxide dehydrogenase subunit G